MTHDTKGRAPTLISRLRERLTFDEGGFGLVEALVASLILVVGIGAAITVFVSSGHAGATAERHQSGVALAQEEIEEIRSMDYDEIGLSSMSYPPEGLGGDLPNPGARVHGPNYVPENATEGRLPVERLVVSDAERSYSLAPYETREIESRSGTETAHIFRFVTWRDETCPLLDLSDLNISLARLGGTVTGLLRGLEVSLGGQGLISTAESSKGTLLGLHGITGSVLQRVDDLLALIDQLLAPATQLIQNVLIPVLDPLEQALAALVGRLDLCDLDLSALSKLETVNAALEGLQGPLQKLTGAELAQAGNEINQATNAAVQAAEQQAFCRSRPLNLNCLLTGLWGTLVSTLNGLVDGVTNLLTGSGSNPGVIDKVESIPPDISQELEEATQGTRFGDPLSDISQLPGLLNDALNGLSGSTDENTKRVVVAVVLEHGGPAGPRQPIWMSTVITDPHVGLARG